MKYAPLLPVIALALNLPMLYAQVNLPADIQQAPELAELKEDVQITKGELPNGLKYIIRPTTEPKERACIRLYVNVGSLNEQEHEKGLSHLLEHLVFNGSRHYKRNELIPELQKRGLGFGGDVNAYTSLNHTLYMLNLPNLNEETVDFSFTVLRDFADGATLTDDAIGHERGIVKSELYARDSASYRTTIATLRHLAPGTRLADYLPIGTEEVIMGAPCDTFRHYYKTQYVPRNMAVLVTGDFKVEDAVGWVKKHFSDMVDAPVPARPAMGELNPDTPADIVVHNAENEASSLILSISAPYVEKADTLQQRIEDTPMELACAMLNQRLARMARDTDSPFISASVNQKDLYEAANVFTMSVTAQHENWQAAMETVLLELRRACQYGFSEAELREIVATTMAAHERQIGSWATVDASAMAERLASSLSEKEVATDPQECLRAFKLAMAQVQKDPDICRRMLANAFDSTRVRLMMSGAKVQDTQPAALRELFNRIMQQKVSAPVAEELPPFAYDHIGAPGSIEKQTIIEDQDITTLTLSNGVRVNLKPVDFRKGQISVSAYVDGGILRMLNTPGLTEMASAVMRQGGLEAHDLTELEQIMAGEHVSMNFSMTADRMRLSGSTTAEDFELQCKLLAAGILYPGFRVDGEERLRRALPSLFNRYETTSGGAYTYQAPRHVYGNDLRFTVPTRKQIEDCNAEKVKDALTPRLQKGAMEVSVVGDFKVEEVIPAILRTFGAMPAREREFTPLTEAETGVSNAKWGMRKFLPYTTDLDKTIVSQMRPAGDGMDYRRNRRMHLLSTITRTKIFDGIRAELGETYSPSVRFAANSDFSNAATITVSSEGVVGNRQKVNTAMDAILVDLGLGNISQEEFDGAIRPYIARSLKNMRTMGYWESALSTLQSDPRQLAMLRDLEQDIKSITLEEIRQLAREIFGPQDKTNYFFTMPAGTLPADANEETPEPPAASPEPEYTIISSEATMANPAWAEVTQALKKKIPPCAALHAC